jgi:hypothetical protein
MAPAGPSSHHVGQATTTASTHTSDFVRRRQSAQTSKSAPASKRTGSYHPRSEMDQADCRGGSVGLARSPICSDSSAWWRCATPVTMRLEKHRQHAQERIVQDGAYTTYVCDLAVHPDYQRSGMVANCWHGPDKRGPPSDHPDIARRPLTPRPRRCRICHRRPPHDGRRGVLGQWCRFSAGLRGHAPRARVVGVNARVDGVVQRAIRVDHPSPMTWLSTAAAR